MTNERVRAIHRSVMGLRWPGLIPPHGHTDRSANRATAPAASVGRRACNPGGRLLTISTAGRLRPRPAGTAPVADDP